jgi:DNA polymerase I-like protein with 3'-5' exonuclease and polymerase domains
VIISLDTETTGVDFWHGAAPFFVSTCDEAGDNTFWEWSVDPLTRKVLFVDSDLREIQYTIDTADEVVLQNAKFDVRALQVAFGGKLRWDWGKVHDTLIAGHLLASNHAHDLTSMAMEYLNTDISKYENRLERAVKEARTAARREHPDWRLANKDAPDMPSARETTWKYDLWLLRAADPDSTLLADYANADSTTTLALWRKQRSLLESRGLWRIYQERMKVLPVAYEMERAGVTVSGRRLEQQETEFREEAERAGRVCVNIAKSMGHELELPKSGNNGSLSKFVFDPGGLGLIPVTKSKKTGKPSLDKATLEHWEAMLPPNSRALTFVRNLRQKRKRDTAVAYMQGYRRFWIPLGGGNDRCRADDGSELATCRPAEWFRLHPSLNMTGTFTLRWSSNNPNEQNISKQEGFNLRYAFGPAPGREWWSMDAKNIELRLPAYEAGEEEMIALFERPDDPPYYGSNHALVAHLLWPKQWEEVGGDGEAFKKKYKATLYQWTKNGNFAVQYGAIESSGTADRAYHLPGAQARIQARFSKIAALNKRMIAFAERHGYVETMPDKTVDPSRGYPLLCTRAQNGYILPTVPLNYHVQGTACWWMMKAMLRCHEFLKNTDARMVLQVHDELVFDFPAGHGEEPWKVNLPKIRRIKRLMEQGGDDLGVPTPVSCEYHESNWSEGVSVDA